jgi:hypothetical protein
VFTVLKELHIGLKARFASYWRKREILQVQRVLHLQDLATSPVNMHPLIRAQHKVEIDAIRAGKLTVVNRRTATNTGIPLTMTRVNTPVQKNSPISLRQFSRTPVPARAINLIKAGLLALPWDVQIIEGKGDANDPDVVARIQIARDCLNKPNNDNSFRDMCEALLTDFLVFGMGVAEVQANPFDDRPVLFWPTDASTIQMVPLWTEQHADTMPRYAQTNPINPAAPTLLFDEELMVIRDNISTDTPFGTGCLEIAYQSVSYLLSAQRMAGIAGADQLGRTLFWWAGTIAPSSMADMRSYLQGELEGMARIGMVGGGPKPDVIEVKPTSADDLLLPWHEMLIRMIALSFNMSAMALNVTNDVNRAVGTVLSDMDFRTAIVPVAKRFQESFTRRIIHRQMGFSDLQMVFLGTEDPDLESKLEMLTSLYGSSGETPNGMRKALGMKPLSTPFADLPQIEMILVQAAATSMTKPPAAPTDPTDPTTAPGGFGDGSGGFSQPAGKADSTPGAGGPLTSPKAPGLKAPKSPMPPKMAAPKAPKLKLFSADLVASMSPAMLRAMQLSSALPKSGISLAQDMEDEQPGILQEMSEQLWEYIESLAEHEISKSKSRKGNLNKKWTNLAQKRYGKSAKRVKSLTQQSLNPVHASGTSQTLSEQTPKRVSKPRKALRY